MADPMKIRATLKGDIAFVSTGDYFKRDGSAWTYQGRVEPLNSQLTGVSAADYRGGPAEEQQHPRRDHPAEVKRHVRVSVYRQPRHRRHRADERPGGERPRPPGPGHHPADQ